MTPTAAGIASSSAPRRAKSGEEGVPGNEGEIDASALPPSIGGDEKPAPRRRRRKVEENEDVSAVG